MLSERERRLKGIEARLHEGAPASTDQQEWAAWRDRRVAAAEEMRGEAFDDGDDELAGHAEYIRDLAVRSARRLRNGPGA